MDKKRSTYTSSNPSTEKDKPSTKAKAKGDCFTPSSSSHTQYFKKEQYKESYKRITRDEYCGVSESISGSSDTFHCLHGLDGKQYTDKGKLRRNLLKELDPVHAEDFGAAVLLGPAVIGIAYHCIADRDRHLCDDQIYQKWTDKCPAAFGWDVAKILEFLVKDPVGSLNIERLQEHLNDFAKTARSGYRIDTLHSLCVILDFLVEKLLKWPGLRQNLVLLLKNTNKPILLNVSSDVLTRLEDIQHYIGFLGYLLMRVEDDELFDLVSEGLTWQLSAPDNLRGLGTAKLRHTLTVAGPVLYQSISRMIYSASAHRFPSYLSIALLLVCDSAVNCINMITENIIHNVFYRFNPYFPEGDLPPYETTPADPQDINVKLGASSTNMSITLSLLLVLLKTLKHYLDDNPENRSLIACPDFYAQRCLIWAYRYECRARNHYHERNTLTVIIHVLVKCYGERLTAFSSLLMPDILTLSVVTEIPPRQDWTSTVNFNTAQMDVHFKKVLIYLSVDFLKTFSYNSFMVGSQLWLLGLMYLLDPGLCYLRARWAPSLFAELRKTALQALVCTLPHTSPNLVAEYDLIRRIMWYIEWYSEQPYELPVLYWCVRLLQVAIYKRHSRQRYRSLKDLFNTHGVIILINLCHTLLSQKHPPMEKSQVIISLTLRLLTSSLELKTTLTCCVYPQLKWPTSINSFATKMLDTVLFSLEKHYIISDRWLISLLNFIWEGIVWKKDYRKHFIANNGVYKLLDLITMAKAPVQCMALAILCDIARSGDAVGHLITWRANLSASNANPNVVKQGSTIATLLASVFRDDCYITGARLDQSGIIECLDSPLMSMDVRETLKNHQFKEHKSLRTSICYTAADIAGSRMSKAFALLNLLSEDLAYKISLADESYNLYKNIKLTPEDEAVLVLCSNYLTIKLNETWLEIKNQNPGLLPQDEDILEEFISIDRNWAADIKRQQEDVIQKARKKDLEEENSLYSFLARVRLNIALDALCEVRCVARSSDRTHITHANLQDAVRAHHRRSVAAKELETPVIRTYAPPLDDQNITGQYVKVYSIHPKSKPKPRDDLSTARRNFD